MTAEGVNVDSETNRDGTWLFDNYRGMRGAFVVTDRGPDDLYYGDGGVLRSKAVDDFLAYGDALANALKASPVTQELTQNLGARPAPAPQAAPRQQQPQQQYVTENNGEVCPGGCGQPMVFKEAFYNRKSGKNVSARWVCESGCKDKGYPMSVWAD